MPKTKGKSPQITLKIPKSLIDEVDRVVGTNGFTSRAEFAKEAIRTLLCQYKTKQILEGESS